MHRLLSSDEKTALQAYVAVLLLRPQLSDDTHAEPTLEHVAALAGIDTAKHWTPDAGFFSRIKKGTLLHLADSAIGGGFVSVYATKKKTEVVEAMADHFQAADEDANNPIYSATRVWVPDGMAATPLSR